MSEEWERGLADAVVAEAAAQRRRARRERELLAGEATFDATLAAAVHHPEVVLVDDAGTEHRGSLVSVGPDAVVLRRAGATTILARRAVAAVGISGPGSTELGLHGVNDGTSDGTGEGRGDPVDGPGPTMAELVAELADDASPVRVRVGPTSWSGTIRAVGEDVADFEPDDGRRRYLRLGSVTEISV